MRRVVELVLLVLVVAVGSRLLTPAPSIPAPAPTFSFSEPASQSPLQDLEIDGVRFDDTLDSVQLKLGKPPCSGRLKVGPKGNLDGFYAEWGGSTRLSWNGSPTVTFWPDHKVLCTIGTTLTVGGTQLALGSTPRQVEQLLGALPTGREVHEDVTSDNYTTPKLSLQLTFDRQLKLTRILRQSTRE